VNSAHIQVVNSWFGFKGRGHHFGTVAEGFPGPELEENAMSCGPYIDALEHGAPLAIKAASIAVSTVLFLIVALPVLAVATAVVA
jgi:hypothetical protein